MAEPLSDAGGGRERPPAEGERGPADTAPGGGEPLREGRPGRDPPPPPAGGGHRADGNRPGGGALAAAAVIFYGLLTAAAWAWLWWRDRTAAIPPAAGGRLGVPASVVLGGAVGLAIAGVFALLARYTGPFARLQNRLAALIGPVDDRQALWIALASGVGEEFFFRLAAQDAVGMLAAAAVFAILHVGPGGLWLWTGCALALGLVFGAMVAAGSGLASVAVAHAVVNYTSLRRMEQTT